MQTTVTEMSLKNIKLVKKARPARKVACISWHECCCDSVPHEPRCAEFPQCLQQSHPCELRRLALAVQQNSSSTIHQMFTYTITEILFNVTCHNVTFTPTKATRITSHGYATSITRCLSQARVNGTVATRSASGLKMGGYCWDNGSKSTSNQNDLA